PQRTRTLTTDPADGGRTRLQTGPLGAVGKVELAWKGTAPLPGAAPLLTAEGRITVRVGAHDGLTLIDFNLKPLRGQPAQWSLPCPPRAVLVKPQLPDDRILAIDKPDPKNPWLHAVKLKGSTSEPVAVSFQVSQLRDGAAFQVGPYAVLG